LERHLRTEDINAEWLSRALGGRYPGTEVTYLAVEDVMWGASGKLRVMPKYNAAGRAAGLPETLIVKGGFGRQPSLAYMYAYEMLSYRDVLPTLDVVTPRCFFADEDPTTGDAMLILEDLRACGATFNNALRPMTFEQARTAVEAIAGAHSRWWGSSELEKGGKLGFLNEIFAPGARARMESEFQPETWARYLDMARAAALPRALTERTRLHAALERLWAFNRRGPHTTFHSDCHVGNTYWLPDGRIGFLDWLVKKGPWYKDIAYFFVTALDAADRREWERDLIAHYLEALAARGVQAPAFEDAWFAYRCELAYSLIVWLCNGDDKGQWQSESINAAGAGRAAFAVLDHDSLALLQ
jgi:hypothetical protein